MPILNSVKRPGRPTRPAALLVYAILGAGLPPAELAAQGSNGDEDRRSVAALPLPAGQSIRVDGHVDEPVWFQATPASGFTQRDPVEGAAPTESTAVYIAYDSDNLYIGAILYDSDPDGILAYQKERDGNLFADDRLQFILDTFLDGRTGYLFEVNPAGLMGDGILGGGGGGFGGGGGGFGGGGGGFGGGGFGVNKSWNGIWEARAARRADGWSVEIEIPFRTLNFDPDQDTWGINFQRTVRRKNEESLWTGYRRNQQLTRPIHAGRLTGLNGMSQGLGLEAKPYAVAGWRYNPDADDPTVDATDFPADVGFDLSYSVTTSLRAALTVNTDFAEVDVDQRRTNLTRFDLRFPERRDFFLEGSGVYAFAPTNGVEPFFSRNIGLYEGNQVPITYGMRLGGQAGRYEVGFLQVHTGQDQFLDDGVNTNIPTEDFTVARIKRNLFQQSSIGALYTRRASAPDPSGARLPDRHTVGADLDLYTSRFLGDKNLQFQAFFVWNSDPVLGGSSTLWERTARGVRLSFPNDIWRISTSYRELDEEHDPAVGFTRRNGFRRLQPTVSFQPRPGDFLGLRQLEFEVRYEHLMDMDWDLETRKTDFKLLGLRFDSGDRVDFTLTQLFERLYDPFDIEDVTIQPGRYNTLSWRLSMFTASRRKVSLRAFVTGGEFWDGTRESYSGGVTLRPMSGLNLSVNYERNNIHLPDDDFSTNLGRVEGGWQLSPWASFTGNVQYDDNSKIVGLFARFRWIIRPGNDLFFVYTNNWLNEGDRFRDFEFSTLSRGASTKINYTYRF
jgi:hypothetical protein